MRLPVTLSRYIIKQFLISILIVFVVFSLLTFVVDVMELIRRSNNRDIPFWVILQMSLLKVPFLVQQTLPFVFLVGGVMTFTKLTRSQELIVARSAGVSVWQFLAPALIATLAIGLITITVINPVSCVLLTKHEHIKEKLLHGRNSLLAISSTGLWLRQKNITDEGSADNGEIIIHARRAGEKDIRLFDVIVFIFDDQGKFTQRIDAKEGVLADDFWQLSNVIVTSANEVTYARDEYFLPTSLTFEQIHDSLAPPETISFWELPGFINSLREAGFSSLRHLLHWYSTLVLPLFLIAMVAIAAIFSLRPPRQGRTGVLITGSIITGFLIYFLTNLVYSLGLSGGMPVLLAAVAPVIVSMLVGVGLLLHLEDG